MTKDFDNPRARIGGNFPPGPFDDLKAKLNEFADAARQWGERTIDDDVAARDIDAFIRGAIKLQREVKEAHDTEKRPHLEAGREVDARYKPLTTLIADALLTAKKRLSAYAIRKEEALREAERRRQEAAARAEQELLDRASDAEARGDLVAAEEARRKASEAGKRAEETRDVKVQIRPSAGAARGLKTYRSARITNINLAILHYREHPDLHALIERLATADIKAAKGQIEIPGVEIIEERRVA